MTDLPVAAESRSLDSYSDEELQAQRSHADAMFVHFNQRLHALNRENDRREWARHAAAQEAVIAAEKLARQSRTDEHGNAFAIGQEFETPLETAAPVLAEQASS